MNRRLKMYAGAAILFSAVAVSGQHVENTMVLNQAGALALAQQAKTEALKLNKNVSVAVLDASGVTILLLRGDQVGPHNTEASRKKAYTSVSTKTASWNLMKNSAADPNSQNLNTVDELLLLGGGVPIWKDRILIGSIGVSGGGGGENDHNIAQSAAENLGFKTINN